MRHEAGGIGVVEQLKIFFACGHCQYRKMIAVELTGFDRPSCPFSICCWTYGVSGRVQVIEILEDSTGLSSAPPRDRGDAVQLPREIRSTASRGAGSTHRIELPGRSEGRMHSTMRIFTVYSAPRPKFFSARARSSGNPFSVQVWIQRQTRKPHLGGGTMRKKGRFRSV